MCQRAGSSSSCQSISCSCRVLISCITTLARCPGHRAGRPPPGRNARPARTGHPWSTWKTTRCRSKRCSSRLTSSLTVTHRSTGNHHIQITASSTALVQMPQGKFTAPWRPPPYRRRRPHHAEQPCCQRGKGEAREGRGRGSGRNRTRAATARAENRTESETGRGARAGCRAGSLPGRPG